MDDDGPNDEGGMMDSFMDVLRLDPEVLMQMAGWVSKLKMYPYFDACYYALMAYTVREDLATGAQLFSRKHPLSCWLSTMLMCFAGQILASVLLGEPPISAFKNHNDVLLASIVWYAMFYSPFDVCHKTIKIKPVKVAVSIMKEVKRTHKLYHGVVHAAKLYPEAYVIIVLVGTIKGAGDGIMRTFEQLIRGVWIPAGNEMLRPAFATKACLAASILFAVERGTNYIAAPHDLVYLGIIVFFVYFKLSGLLLNIHDPFAPIENLFCAIFMGGIWDAVSRAVAASRERRAGDGQSADATEAKKDL